MSLGLETSDFRVLDSTKANFLLNSILRDKRANCDDDDDDDDVGDGMDRSQRMAEKIDFSANI